MKRSPLFLLALFLAGIGAGAMGLRTWQKHAQGAPLILGESWSSYRRGMMREFVVTPTIVMLGDSTIERGDWPELTGCTNIANFGIAGDTSRDVLARLDDVVSLKPKAVFLGIGANDPSPEVTDENVKQIAQRLEASGVHLQRLPAQPPEAHLDRLHPNALGYKLWRDAIADDVKRFCD